MNPLLVMFQKTEIHLENHTEFYKISKEFPTTIGTLCDKEFRDVTVQY